MANEERKTLREWRLSRFMTQRELAEQIHRTVPTLSAWEVGRKQPRLSNIREVAKALGVRPSQIIFPEYEAPKNAA